MLGLIGLLLVIWVAFIVIGFLIHAIFWLAIVGIVLFLATAGFGWVKRNTHA